MMPVETLHVTGIPVDVDKEDLKIIFSPYGNVLYTFCAAPRDPSAKTRFGFVEFSTVREAEYAMQELNGKPPYKFHISFAKQQRLNKDKRKQNQMSEGTNIRITTFGNRREITLFNQYSDRDKYQYDENRINYSEFNGMDYNIEKYACNTAASKQYLVDDKYARNWPGNKGDGLLPTPPYGRLDRMPFESNCNQQCSHHSCCSHCMHCNFSSVHGLNPTCNNNLYSLNDRVLGTDRRRNVLQTKYQKEGLLNQNTSIYAERNSHPNCNISDLRGKDFKSRNDSRGFHPENRPFNKCSNEEKFRMKNNQKEVFKQKDNQNDDNVFLIQKKFNKFNQDKKPSAEKNNFTNRNQDERKQDYKFKRQQENEDNRHNNRNQTIPFKNKENKQTAPNQKKNNSQKLDWNMREKESLAEYIEPSLMCGNEQSSENIHVSFDKYENFDIDTIVAVSVCFGYSPDELWIHKLPDAVENLKELSKDLQIYCEQAKSYSPQIGEICGALFSSDSTWYRARIDNIYGNGLFMVYFVDYGNSEIIPASNIRQLESQYLKLPFQAIPCKLAFVKSTTNIWSDKATKIILSAGNLMAKFIRKLKNKYEVDLIYENGDSVSNLLIKQNYARQVKDIYMNRSSNNYFNSQSTENASKKNNLPIENRQNDFVFSSTTEELNKSSIDLQNKNERFISSAIGSFTPGMSLKLQIIYCSTNKDFWVHPVIPEANDVLQKLEKLIEKSSKCSKYIPSESDVVIAQSALYNCWYRAYVINKSDNGYNVRFIDYGNEENISEIVQISSDELCLPSYALHCVTEHEHLQKFITEGNFIDVKVTSCDNEKILMDFEYSENEKVHLIGYPWYHNLETKRSTTDVCSVTLNEKLSDSEFFISSGIENLKPGISLKLQVIFCSTNKNFWVHPIIPEAIEALEKLQTLDENVSKHNKYTPCKLGEVVIAQSVADESWYRAYVIEESKNGYKVRFLDYGNEEIINEILHILPEELCLPSYALHCIIEQEVDLLEFIFETSFIDVKIISCDNEKVYMNFEYSENEIISIIGYPWYHDLRTICQNNLTPEISINSQNKREESIHNDVSETKDIRNDAYTADKMIPTENIILNQNSNSTETVNENIDLSQKETFTNAMKLKPENMIEEIVPSILKILHPDDKINLAVITTFPDKFEFWALVSIPEVIDTLYEMQNSLINIPLSNDITPSVGDVIAAQSVADQDWYRAYVLNVKSDSIKVRYIDYGNEEEITVFKALPSDQINIISAVVYCSIQNISEVVDEIKLKEQLFSSETILAKVNEVQSNVMYLSTFTENNPIINIKALPWYHDLSSSQPVSTMVPYEDRQALDKSMENLQNSSTCSNKNFFLYKDCKFVEFPISEIDVLITNIINPETIYCQLADINQFSVLLKLNESITSFCIESAFDNYHPLCGEMCLAKFSEDELWYRAVPLKYIGGKVQVLFVDFGNIDIIKFEDTRQMLPQFMELPIQAVHCMLSEVKSQNWNNEMIYNLLQLLPQEEIRTVQVIKKFHTDNNFVYILDIPYLDEHLLKTDMNKLNIQPKEK